MSYISDLRKIVGHRPIMSTASMCIIYDKEQNMILLERRSDNGQWCVPGGALELGEDQESVELKWFSLDELPENILATQIDYITEFLGQVEKW